MPSQPVTVTASFAKEQYSVLFDANGGTGTMNAVSGLYGDTAELPVAAFTADAGTSFAGWNTEPDGSGTTARKRTYSFFILFCQIRILILKEQFAIIVYNV